VDGNENGRQYSRRRSAVCSNQAGMYVSPVAAANSRNSKRARHAMRQKTHPTAAPRVLSSRQAC